MIWTNPWAWLGLVSLALPVLIHLLGRGRAKVVPFPTLRFLTASKLLPTRRTRIHDAALLLVRLGILLAAVAALARPVWLTATRKRVVADAIAQAVIVERGVTRDSSTSGATSTLVVESPNPAREIRGAVDWLERQPGRRELVIHARFRRGLVDSVDLAAVPASIGIRLIAAPLPDSSVATTAFVNGGTSSAQTRITDSSTAVVWTTSAADAPDIATILVAPQDRARADAAMRAALSVGVPLPLDERRPVTVAYPGAASINSAPIDSAWMIALVARLRADSTLIAATSRLAIAATDTSGLVAARDSTRRPVVTAKRAGNQLLFVAAFDPGSVASAALLSAIARARSIPASLADIVTAPIPAATLATWQRPSAVDDSARALGDESDGRWLWTIALLLLGIETLMRRIRRLAESTTEVAHERAA